jgi:hypothetical protein
MPLADFTVQPLSGFVHATEFTFSANTSGTEYLVWDIGDGTPFIYNDSTVLHTYKFPGIYNVSLTAIDIFGNSNVKSYNLNVELLLRDYVVFTHIPERFANPGIKTETPFKIQVQSSQITQPLVVDLFATNSKSIPYEHVPKQWSFLNPTWRFYDKNDNIVTSLNIPHENVYYNGKVVAVSGEAEFYFVDSTSTGNPSENCPLLLTCNLQTSGFQFPNESAIYPYPSYANNKNVRSACLWLVNDLRPDLLKVTRNYIDEQLPEQWQNIKIPFIVTAHSNRDLRIPGSKSEISDIIFSYPDNNNAGLKYPVEITLTNLLTSDYTIDEAPLNFQAKDEQNFRTGGYLFTTCTSKVSANSVTISVKTTANNEVYDLEESFIDPYLLGPNSFVWISNPNRNTINRVNLIPYPSSCKDIQHFKNNKILVEGNIIQTEVPYITASDLFNYNLTGFSGIYGIAIDPRNFDFYAADAELDCLYKFNSTGTLLSTYSFTNILTSENFEAFTPANISLDQNYNIWISLFNSVSVLKFDPNFNLLFNTAPSGSPITTQVLSSNLVTTSTSASFIEALSTTFTDFELIEVSEGTFLDDVGIQYTFTETVEDPFESYQIFDGDFLLKPPSVETDRLNNCWVTYAHPLCSILVKYSPTGKMLSKITLPQYSTPGDMAITPNNNVWVANNFNPLLTTGNIQLYHSELNSVLYTIEDIPRPGYLALDLNNNLWFTFGTRNIGCFNYQSNELVVWPVQLGGRITTPTSLETFLTGDEVESSVYLEDEELGGIAVDPYNRVWVIDAYSNTVTIIPSATPDFDTTLTRIYKIRPDSVISYYPDLQTGQTFTITVTSEINEVRSAQAVGDWTGNKWYQKYVTASLLTPVITGESLPFSIETFYNKHQIRKINDSYNMSEYLQSLAKPENLAKNDVLWNQFIPSVVGSGKDSNKEDIGRKIYEAIANFNINHTDIDTCNIDQLLSLAEQTGVDYLDYGVKLPNDIAYMFEIASIPRHKLYGFLNVTPDLRKSLGEMLDPFTVNLTANNNIIILSKLDNSISLYKPPTDNGLNVYPLTAHNFPGYAQPVTQYYAFYNYRPFYDKQFIESLIDWESPYTYLTPTLSTFEDWYGDEGILEKTFNYLLTKNLFDK